MMAAAVVAVVVSALLTSYSNWLNAANTKGLLSVQHTDTL